MDYKLIDCLLINVSQTDITSYRCSLCFFLGGQLKNHPKLRMGPNISSVNIVILNQDLPMNNIIPLPESMVARPGP